MTKVIRDCRCGGIGFLFGLFVGGEEALTHRQCALQTVQAWRIGSPVLMAKVLVVGTSGDDEGVIGQVPTAVDHPLVRDVKSRHFPHERPNILGLAENLTQRHGNISWRETGDRHLVEQRKEEVIITKGKPPALPGDS
jgi:hypothetical protein